MKALNVFRQLELIGKVFKVLLIDKNVHQFLCWSVKLYGNVGHSKVHHEDENDFKCNDY